MAHKTPEMRRLVAFYKVYMEATPALSMNAKLTAQGGGGGSTPSATASKTMATRKQTHGSKGTSESGVQNIKDAGKQRTQSGQAKQP